MLFYKIMELKGIWFSGQYMYMGGMFGERVDMKMVRYVVLLLRKIKEYIYKIKKLCYICCFIVLNGFCIKGFIVFIFI